MAERSLFIFSQSNRLRRYCYRLVKDDRFEWVYNLYPYIQFIFMVIIITSIQLVMDTYISYDHDIVLGLSLTFNIIFTLEAMTKIVAYGFVLDPSAYLRESWSQLDFFIVIVSWLDMIVSNADLSWVRVLKIFRTLRPLRFISHNVQMKLIVTALLESISGIANVVIVIILVWMMFGILAINLMKDKMYSCANLPGHVPRQGVNRAECAMYPTAEWRNNDMNFDNIINSMVSLFVLSTMENWTVYIWVWVDGTTEGPVKNNQPYLIFFAVAFILIGGLFLINLFVGVISLNYSMAEKRAKNQFLTEE